MTTTQAVNAALVKGGHQKSTSSRSAIKGWPLRSRGFSARKYDEKGTVSVRHLSGDFSNRGDWTAELEKYEATLTAAGFQVQLDTSFGQTLLVTKAARQKPEVSA